MYNISASILHHFYSMFGFAFGGMCTVLHCTVHTQATEVVAVATGQDTPRLWRQ